jgi:hypothetical protein
MLLHGLIAPTMSGVVGSMTQPCALTYFVTTSQSYTLGPSTATFTGTYSLYLDSDASFI